MGNLLQTPRLDQMISANQRTQGHKGLKSITSTERPFKPVKTSETMRQDPMKEGKHVIIKTNSLGERLLHLSLFS